MHSEANTQPWSAGAAPPNRRPSMRAMLPAGTAVRESFDHTAEAPLFPEEALIVAGAVEKRRCEFATGRHLARQALADLGILPAPIPQGAGRDPRWPLGIVGSITHCTGYCAAVVSRAALLAAIGIDAEPRASLPDGVLRLISSEPERRWIRARRGDGICWDRLLFSAKEAVFKAWFPLTGRWLDFDEVVVTFNPDLETFRAEFLCGRLMVASRVLDGFEGRYVVADRHVFACVAIDSHPSPGRSGRWHG